MQCETQWQYHALTASKRAEIAQYCLSNAQRTLAALRCHWLPSLPTAQAASRHRHRWFRWQCQSQCGCTCASRASSPPRGISQTAAPNAGLLPAACCLLPVAVAVAVAVARGGGGHCIGRRLMPLRGAFDRPKCHQSIRVVSTQRQCARPSRQSHSPFPCPTHPAAATCRRLPIGQH